MEVWIFSKPKPLSNKLKQAWVSVIDSFQNAGLFIHLLFLKNDKTTTFFDLLVPLATKFEVWETPEKISGVGGQVVEQEIQIKNYANTPLLHRFTSPFWCGGDTVQLSCYWPILIQVRSPSKIKTSDLISYKNTYNFL